MTHIFDWCHWMVGYLTARHESRVQARYAAYRRGYVAYGRKR